MLKLPRNFEVAHRILLCSGVIICVISCFITLQGDLRQNIPLFLSVFFVAFGAYLAALYVIKRTPWSYATGFYIIAIAIISRIILCAGPPSLSDDIYRYLWDGKVTVHGINPYMHAPDSLSLEHLRDTDHARINHKDLTTIYPPLAQGIFAAAALRNPTIYKTKSAFILFDCLTIIIIMLLLHARRLNPLLGIIYAWNPLVLIEFSHSGHNDSLGIFFLVFGLFLFERRHTYGGFMAIALSFVSKYFAAILLPFFFFKKTYITGLFIFFLTVTLAYLPFISAGSHLFESLLLYFRQWEFNTPLYTVLNLFTDHTIFVRVLIACGVIVFSCYQGFKQNDPVRYAFLVIGCVLLFSPTLHPWYVTWIVPLLCFFHNRAWILFTGLVAVSYWILIQYTETGLWHQNPWILMIEYAPFYGLLCYDRLKK